MTIKLIVSDQGYLRAFQLFPGGCGRNATNPTTGKANRIYSLSSFEYFPLKTQYQPKRNLHAILLLPNY